MRSDEIPRLRSRHEGDGRLLQGSGCRCGTSELGEAAFVTAWRAGRPFSVGAARHEVAALAQAVPPGAATGAARPGAEAGLTRRERDVLRLLAEHKSDREIAEALFLSLRTVNWHVRAILGKLEVASRREAITRAQAENLV